MGQIVVARIPSVISVAVGLMALAAGMYLLAACASDSTQTQEGGGNAATAATSTPFAVPVNTTSPTVVPTRTGSTPAVTSTATASATVASSTTPSTTTSGSLPTPTESPLPTVLPSEPAVVPEPPQRDLYELARSLRYKSRDPIPFLHFRIPTDLQVGQMETFRVLSNADPVEFREISARLEHVSDSAYWYVQQGARFDADALREAAVTFEERILPVMQASYGPLWSAEDPSGLRLTILHANSRGLAGYYSAADEYPVQVHENSNQRKMIYLNPSNLRIGSDNYLATLAHELQHAINRNLNGGQTTWLNEGLSKVAEKRLGWRPRSGIAYAHSVPSSLVHWPLSILESSPYYGSAFLFVQFLSEQVGSPGSLEPLVRADHRGIHAVNAYLETLGTGETFESIFGRWTVAGYLSESGYGGAYGYADWWPSIEATDVVKSDGSRAFSQPQFSARYLLLDMDAESAEVSFSADVNVRLLPEYPPTGGHCWWGNYGDAISTTLTREFDLSGLQRATLKFTTWYTIEEDWDYAYVQVSTDGGSTWDILQGSLSSTDNPSLNAYGPGYTGESGGWVSDSVDLTAYVGGRVLVRFHYVTDDAINGPGICLDSVAIPELGFQDDVSTNQGWTTEGFYRTDNLMPQDFVVHLVEIRGDGVTVTPMSLDDNNWGSLTVQDVDGADEVVLVVGSLAENSRQPAHYTVTVESGS